MKKGYIGEGRCTNEGRKSTMNPINNCTRRHICVNLHATHLGVVISAT